jgi:DNA-directed RNA polymerase specialized sigma24 family protein
METNKGVKMNFATALSENRQSINYMSGRYSGMLEPDDIQQMCKLAIADGLEKWDSSKSSIKTYMMKKMNGQIRNKLKERERLKRLGTTYSLDGEYFNHHNVIAIPAIQESSVVVKEYLAMLVVKLTQIERKTLELLIKGYNAEEIALMLSRTKQNISIIKMTIAKKMKQIMAIERMQIEALDI